MTQFWLSLPASQRTRIEVKLELLQINPYHYPLLDIKLRRGMDSIYRLRVGKYRMATKPALRMSRYCFVLNTRGDLCHTVNLL